MGVRTNTARMGRALPFDIVVSFPSKSWTGNSSTTWTTAGNWVGSSAPANDTTSHVAKFEQSSYPSQPNFLNNSIAGFSFTGSADVTFGSGATGNIGAQGITVASTAGNVTLNALSISANQTWDIASGKTLAQASGLSGSGNITKTSAGTFTLINNNSSYTGVFRQNAGTLNINLASNPWGTQKLSLYGGIIDNTSGTAKTVGIGIDFNGDCQYSTSSGTSSNNLTINVACTVSNTPTITCLGGGTLSIANLSGGGSFTKAGSGILILSGTSSYTGSTSISAGTLQVSNYTGGGTITVAGGTLAGQGTSGVTTGPVVVGSTSGSTLVAPTSFFDTGNLSFTNASSTLTILTDGTTGCGRIRVTGTAALNGCTVNFDPTTGLNAGTYTVISTTSGISGAVVKGTAPSGRTFSSLTISGNNLVAVIV